MSPAAAARRHEPQRAASDQRELARSFELARRADVHLESTGDGDWLAIGPSGMWVIDATVRANLVERRFDAVGRRGGLRLFIDGRDRSKLVERVAGHAEQLRARLGRHGLGGTPIFPCLCVAGAGWNRRPRSFDVAGVVVTWPAELAELVVLPGPITEAIQAELQAALAS